MFAGKRLIHNDSYVLILCMISCFILVLSASSGSSSLPTLPSFSIANPPLLNPYPDNRVSSYTPGPVSTQENDQLHPAVAFNPAAGEFLVVYEHEYTLSDHDIYARRISRDGVPLGSVIAIATSTTSESNPDVAYNPNTGEYLVVWEHAYSETDYNIYGIRLNSLGEPVGASFPIETSSNHEIHPAVAAYQAADLGYLLAFMSSGTGSQPYDIKGRILGSTGIPQESVLSIAGGVADQSYPAIAAGEVFLVAWQMEDLESGDGDYEIHSRSIGPDGSLYGEVPVSTAAYDQRYPQVAFNSTENEFLVVWEDHRLASGEDWDIFSQRMTGAGAVIGENVSTASDGTNHREVPDAVYLPGA
ncbi:MAG: hypothetical protein MUO62_04020, partial [Anaerolineales bacterium]|nr:hypothetical protein [Anaerolineales bacterium]